MTETLPDLLTLSVLAAGALVAGFTTGFAGFGTALVASGIWLHVLPPVMIPPLVTIAAATAHVVGLATAKPHFDWPAARPFLIGGLVGIPVGVGLLSVAGPEMIRLAVGVSLIVYAASQLLGTTRLHIGNWGGCPADAVVGVGGGVLGGFAGLSGPFPIIWLQMRGGASASQRAIYQPFNLVVLAIAAGGMAVAGLVTAQVLLFVAIATPVTILGSWLGARAYLKVSDQVFRTVVLSLLLASGAGLLLRGLA